jgi:hypothetical protein
MGPFRRTLGLPALTASVLLLTGCGTSQTPARPEPATALTSDEKAVLHRAEERLIHRCMQEHGWRYTEVPPPVPASERTGDDRSFPYLVDDVAWAKKYGYGALFSAAAEANTQVTGPTDGLSSRQVAEWTRTLYGTGRQVSLDLPSGGRLSTSDRGCLAAARKVLYGDLVPWFRAKRTTDDIEVLVRRRVRDDRRYDTAMTSWRRCARVHGHDVRSPGELRDTIFRRPGSGSAPTSQAREISTAVVEATCAQTSGLSRAVRQLEAHWRPKVRGEFRTELDELARLERAALPEARSVLRRSPAP